MVCHNGPAETGQCRMTCTHTEVTTEYFECGIHEHCMKTTDGSICKCPRFVNNPNLNIAYKPHLERYKVNYVLILLFLQTCDMA